MTPQAQPVRHPDTTITWPAALATWFISGGTLVVTAMLSVVGLLMNIFSAGHQERQSFSWAAFDSAEPSWVMIFIVLAAAWLAFTQGWCFMAGAAFKQTYKSAYIWNAVVNAALVIAAIISLTVLLK